MKKTIFKTVLLGCAIGISVNVQAEDPQGPIAAVTNVGTGKVLVNTGQTTLDVQQNTSVPGRSGDIVSVLAPNGKATVRFDDNCEVTLTDNQRLILADSGLTCRDRIAAVKSIETYQSEALGAGGRTGTATTVAEERDWPGWVGPVGTIVTLGIPALANLLSGGDGNGSGDGTSVTQNVPNGVQP